MSLGIENIDDLDLDSALEEVGIQVKRTDDTNKEASESGINIVSDDKPKAVGVAEFMITEQDRDYAVQRKLVPENYRNASFRQDKIESNLRSQYKKSNGIYRIKNFKSYVETCNEIISTIRMKRVPRRSWLIGAPNGFGKSSFVNECLITMLKHGWVTAPYISLNELAQIRVAEEQRLMRPFTSKLLKGEYREDADEIMNDSDYYRFKNAVKPKDIVKVPNMVPTSYSWNEYLNAKCLFVHFTDVISKDLESHTLYQLLNIRSAKGLPTIAMISTSIQPYVMDNALKELVWDEILDYDENSNNYDRVAHVSTYKQKNMDMGFNKSKSANNDTGIID